MKKFKVRITKSPEQMKYGGQSSYGLNLGHRTVYSDMPDNPHEELSKSLKPVPRSKATIEAEKGETAYGDFDGDGLLEHKFIGGKPHSQGGTPLDVPEGTFIYSNTKSMRIGGPTLQNFGKSANDKKKYTPAELAKQYDINKYKGILTDPNTDNLSKSTAKIMMANYQKKLAELALVQESKKGFPQGIPKVAAPLMAKMQQQNGPQEESAEGQEPQEGQAMYGGGMAYGGVSGQNPHPGTYSDGYSGTFSGGNYFPQGGTFVPDYGSSAYGLPQYEMGSDYGYGGGYMQMGGSSSTQEQILETITQLLQKGSDPQTLLQQLVEAKIPQQQATKLIEYAMKQLQSGQNAGMQQESATAADQQAYEYGGYYAEGGEEEDTDEEFITIDDGTGPKKVKKSEIGAYEKRGYRRVPGTNVWRKGDSTIEAKDPTIIKGTPGQAAVIRKGTPGKKYVPRQNAWWNSLTPAEKAAHNAKVRKMIETDPAYTGTKDEVITPEVKATEDQKVCDPGYTFNATTGKCEKISEKVDEVTYEEDPTKKKRKPVVNNIGTMAPWNMAAAMAVPPKKYFPYYSNIYANIPNPTFYDPERELAAGEEQAMALQQGARFLDPQSYSARASAIQGKAAENAANVLGKYNNLNVGVANQFSPLQTEILNKVMEYQAGRADKTYMGNVVTNQQYDNALRAYLNNIAKVKTKDFDNTAKMNMLNATNPYYTINKRGQLQFRPGVDAMSVITGSNALSPDNDQYADYIKEANRLKGMGLDPRTINAALQVKYPGLTSGSSTSRKNISNINNQYLQAMSGSQSAYPYNMDQYDMTDLYQ